MGTQSMHSIFPWLVYYPARWSLSLEDFSRLSYHHIRKYTSSQDLVHQQRFTDLLPGLEPDVVFDASN